MNLVPEEVKALTWREPYATLMLHGKIETRVQPTKYRGWVAIHAGKAPFKLSEIKEISGEHYRRVMEITAGEEWYLGSIIAVGRLIDCRPMLPSDEAKCFVKYKSGLWCHVYDSVIRLTTPIPFRGKQGWSRLNPGFINNNLPIQMLTETSQTKLF